MVKLVFARHGESEWNKANLFTGWADVDLSEKGTQQAIDAGKLIKEAGIEFDQAYTSVLKRAIKTTNLALEASDQLWVPVEKSWRLNERALPFWEDKIAPALKDGKNVFVGAHGNSIRALVKHIKQLSDDEIMDVEIPNFPPLVFEFDDKLNVVNEYYLGK